MLVDVMKAPEGLSRLDSAAGRVVARQRRPEAQCTARTITVGVADELREVRVRGISIGTET